MCLSGFSALSIRKVEGKATSLFLGENLLLKGSKESKILFNLLLAFMMGPLIFSLYLGVNFFINS